MISVVLGKRYERLLFFTAPLTLATILIALVAKASTQQSERVDARCFAMAAVAIEGQLEELDKAFKTKKEKWEESPIEYRLLLSRTWIYGSDEIGPCYSKIDKELDAGLENRAPSEIIKIFKDRAHKLLETPLNAYGISFPKEATVDILVTKINMDFLTLSRILQIVLLPAILLWLGSLYGTRYREALTISRASQLSEVFPHIINQYPAFDPPSIRKRDPIAPYHKSIAKLWYGFTRVTLLAIFVIPPVAFYLYGLFLSGSEDFNLAYLIGGVVVGLFTITNLLAEFLPSHYHKIFPSQANAGRF